MHREQIYGSDMKSCTTTFPGAAKEERVLETVTCALCGSDRSRVVLRQGDLIHATTSKEFTVVRCEGCGLLYLNPRPAPDEIGRYYPARYFVPSQPKSRSGVERWLKNLSAAVKRWIREDFYGYPSSAKPAVWRGLRKLALWPEKARRRLTGREALPWSGEGRLLDVGCGPGVNLQTFQEQGWDVHGIDVNESAVAMAREKVGDRVHHGTLDTAPFDEESFDVVSLNHSLEHMFSPLETLERVRRLLKPGGMVVIEVPNADSWEAQLFGSSWVPWDVPRHLYHFGKSTLTRALERSGFHVQKVRTGLGPVFFMASLERTWMSRYGGTLPAHKLLKRVIATPLCLLAGHLGQGTELKVYAVKRAEAGAEARAEVAGAGPRVMPSRHG